jgi:hypothetical protein
MAAPVRVEHAPRGRPVWEKVGARIEALLSESPRWTGGKQRLTATRLHQMLVGEGLEVGVTTVKAHGLEKPWGRTSALRALRWASLKSLRARLLAPPAFARSDGLRRFEEREEGYVKKLSDHRESLQRRIRAAFDAAHGSNGQMQTLGSAFLGDASPLAKFGDSTPHAFEHLALDPHTATPAQLTFVENEVTLLFVYFGVAGRRSP